jgi:hypothetical protein
MCDAEGRFQFLPIDSPTSMARMHRFVERHGLPRGSVELPFVVLMDGERRALLHGPAFADWCTGLVRAATETPSMTPARLLGTVVAPHLGAHTLHLLRHALGAGAAAAATDGDERMPPAEDYGDEAADGDGAGAGAPTTGDGLKEGSAAAAELVIDAVTPPKSTDRPERKVSVAEILQQSNRRDAMQQITSPR